MSLIEFLSIFPCIWCLLYANESNDFCKKDKYLIINKIAALFHKQWQQVYRQQNPNIKTNFKKTLDKDFIDNIKMTIKFNNEQFKNVSNELYLYLSIDGKIGRSLTSPDTYYVDILNMDYSELPIDWQNENRATATAGFDIVIQTLQHGENIDTVIEELAGQIHELWISRNNSTINQELQKPYQELGDIEKEKDRNVIRIANQIIEQDC
ncbi:unnamed protein product [Didymodactylos carnosus]|uniref:Uncharacterized protein n=1 Tax=Didymodactylos carnosus TaxID=1234261 RepID=A0A814I3J2_9BILA|nr:unnamed protein product [Didymodactylos carnosus]CAF1018233.1 unnamed protein product [Didymodactylos carnosus]CAF3580571.1 unnamed protein product [Didymodactylos carnosus]CAF3789699.1 unnamed protein product [Didymodactylos carnosus]